MPRRVVPIWSLPSFASPSWSSSLWYGMIRCALAETLQAAEVDPPAPELVDLRGEHDRVDDHAVADRAQLAGVEDPRRDQVELERLAVADDRVAGVVAALEADHEVGLLGEQVHDLPLPLVAPLGADDDDSWHGETECRPGAPQNAPSPSTGTVGSAPRSR